MREFFKSLYDLGDALDSLQAQVNGFRNMFRHTFQIALLVKFAEALQLFGCNRAGGPFRLHCAAKLEKFRDRAPGIFQEPDVVSNELRGSINFMGDARRQLTNALKFLRLTKL